MKMAIFVTFRWRSVCLRTFTTTNLTYHHQPLHPQYRCLCYHRHIRLVDTDLYNLVMKKFVRKDEERSGSTE